MSLNRWHTPKDNFRIRSISNRFKQMDKSIDIYLKNNTKNNLHDIRIDLRRLRYALEIFSVYFKGNKKYEKFYNDISTIQSVTGGARDLDVIEEYARSINIYDKKIEKDQKSMNIKVNKKLKSFIKSKCYNNFKKTIKNGK